jgi:hypothetical protein
MEQHHCVKLHKRAYAQAMRLDRSGQHYPPAILCAKGKFQRSQLDGKLSVTHNRSEQYNWDKCSKLGFI